MFRDILTNKWVIGGVVFLIVFSVACVFWYRYDTAPFRKATVETEKLLHHSEKYQKAYTKSKAAEQASGLVSVESITPTSEKLITETDDTRKNSSVFGNPKGGLIETQSTEKTDAVKVSPYGFGPYPEVPDGFLEDMLPSWEWSEEKKLKFGPEHMRNQEAIDRVLIKLWNQGDQEFHGAVGDYNTVYPLYPNIVYIKWNEIELPDGRTHREISGYLAAEGFPTLTMEQRMKGEIPTGYRVLDMNEDGINVSEFLNTSN